MIKFIFTNNAKKEFEKIDKNTQARILDKLKFLKDINNISNFIRPLVNFKPATHRLRVWNFRLILQKDKDTFIVFSVWNRWNIYK